MECLHLLAEPADPVAGGGEAGVVYGNASDTGHRRDPQQLVKSDSESAGDGLERRQASVVVLSVSPAVERSPADAGSFRDTHHLTVRNQLPEPVGESVG